MINRSKENIKKIYDTLSKIAIAIKWKPNVL